MFKFTHDAFHCTIPLGIRNEETIGDSLYQWFLRFAMSPCDRLDTTNANASNTRRQSVYSRSPDRQPIESKHRVKCKISFIFVPLQDVSLIDLQIIQKLMQTCPSSNWNVCFWQHLQLGVLRTTAMLRLEFLMPRAKSNSILRPHLCEALLVFIRAAGFRFCKSKLLWIPMGKSCAQIQMIGCWMLMLLCNPLCLWESL